MNQIQIECEDIQGNPLPTLTMEDDLPAKPTPRAAWAWVDKWQERAKRHVQAHQTTAPRIAWIRLPQVDGGCLSVPMNEGETLPETSAWIDGSGGKTEVPCFARGTWLCITTTDRGPKPTYDITDQASGWRVIDAGRNLAKAKKLLRALEALTDWTDVAARLEARTFPVNVGHLRDAKASCGIK